MSDPSPPHLDLLLGAERLPLRYLAEGGRLYLLAGEISAAWPPRALRDGTVRVEREGRAERWRVGLVAEAAERARVVARFRTEAGEARFQEWFPHPGRLLRLTPAEGARAAEPAYDTWLRSEFDSVAESYADSIRGNPIEAYLRERSLDYLRRHLHGRRRLLELGSGPGSETLPLLKDGHEVVAVDVSEAMLQRLGANARAAGVSERLTSVRGRLRDLASLEIEGPFDGGFSTFGALSCEPDLAPVRDGLAGMLNENAPFVAGVLNRTPALELFAYSASARWRRAFGRLRSPVPVGRSRFSVDCFAHSPAGLARRFRPGFVPSDREGVGVVVPPPDQAGRVGNRWALDRLGRLDRALGRRTPFRSLGDHFLICLRRVAPPMAEAA